jgi:hypothetical protein
MTVAGDCSPVGGVAVQVASLKANILETSFSIFKFDGWKVCAFQAMGTTAFDFFSAAHHRICRPPVPRLSFVLPLFARAA